MPERIVEITSYHAMLGCAVAGMGISLMPRSVLTTFPDAKLLSVHSLPPALARAPISLFWRKGMLSPKVRALIDVLTVHSDSAKPPRAGRKNGNSGQASANGRSRA
jgi:DNA-binding transcriptional LysR family regulator